MKKVTELKNILSRFDLTGRGVVVIGFSQGIGINLAMALSEVEATVGVAARNGYSQCDGGYRQTKFR